MGGLSQRFLTETGVNSECWTSVGVPRKPRPLPFHVDDSQTTEDEDRLSWLSRTIETEIIPRLLLAHRMAPNGQVDQADDPNRSDLDEVAELTRIILTQEVGVASALIQSMRARGVALETVYLDLLAPTARRLGEMWEADLSDFTEVTVGLWRLQQILHELSAAFREENETGAHGRKALLIPAPGEQHTLGLFMVSEFFRRAGWDVWGEPPGARDGLMGILRTEWFDVVGLSAGCESRLDLMSALITAMRKVSRNATVGILVGGPLFIAHPEYVAQVGADGMGIDARQAILQAEKIAAMRERRPD